MKVILFLIVGCLALNAQVTATVSNQGTEVVKIATGYTPKNSNLIRIDVCNAGTNDTSVSTSRVASAIITQENYGIYDSNVVNTVLAALQDKDVYTRAQKALTAMSNTAVLLTAVFKKWSPLTALLVDSAPAIASAILPAVGSARDLASIGQQIMQDNGSFVLGKMGSGNDCHANLAVAMSGTIKIDRVSIQ